MLLTPTVFTCAIVSLIQTVERGINVRRNRLSSAERLLGEMKTIRNRLAK